MGFKSGAFIILLVGLISFSGPSHAKNCETRFFMDPTNSTQPAQLPEKPMLWPKLSSHSNAFGFTNKTLWLFVTCPDLTLTQDRFVEIGYPPLDEIQVWSWPDLVKRGQTGDRTPVNARFLFHRLHQIPLAFDPSGKGLILAIRSESSLQIPIAVRSGAELAKRSANENLIMGLYYGILLGLILYNAILALTLGRRTYFIYALYIVSFLVLQLGLNGYAQIFIWPDNTDLANISVPAFAWLSFALIYIFSFDFLDIQRRPRPLRLTMQGLSALSFIFCISVITGATGYAFSIQTASAFGILSSFFLFAVSGILAFRKETPARIFMIAWSFYLAGMLVVNLKNFGFLPSIWPVDYSMQIGACIEAILLSIAIGFKIRQQEQDLIGLEQSRIIAEERAAISAQVAHDIRSPVSALGVAARICDGIPPEVRKIMLDATARIEGIASDLLKKSLLFAKPRPENLTAIVHQVFNEKMLQLAPTPEVLLKLEISFAEDVQVLVLADDLKRVLSNLINNSIEALRESRGEVRLRLFSPPHGGVGLAVSDNGHGIPPHLLSHLGKKPGFTTKSGNGFGLGLYHARKQIESWGGKLSIHSKLNEGTTVIIYLPDTRAQKKAGRVGSGRLEWGHP